MNNPLEWYDSLPGMFSAMTMAGALSGFAWLLATL